MSASDMPKDQAMWNSIFSFGFLVLFLLFFWLLTDGLNTFAWIQFIGPFDVTLLALATYRAIRLLSYDKIFNFARQWFLDKKGDSWVKPSGGPRRTVTELLECIWCTGLWSALFLTTLYLVDPIGRFLVIVFAIAALGSLLQNISQMVARVGQK